MDFSDAIEKQAFYAARTHPDYFKYSYSGYGISSKEMWAAFKSMVTIADTYFMSQEVLKLLVHCARELPSEVVIETPPTPTGFLWIETGYEMVEDVFMRGFVWHQNEGGQTILFAFVGEGSQDPAPMGLGTHGPNDTILDSIMKSISVPSLTTIDKEISSLAVFLYAAFNVFVKQRLLKSTIEHPHRASARRAAREIPVLKSKQINVIRLRAVDYVHSTSDEHEHEPVEWSHRWLVRGHWRKQYYPSTKTHHAIFITPYVKGPSNLPLVLPEHTVYGVTR